MIRTIISLDSDDKAWLDRRAREENVPMTELVRIAVRRLRESEEAEGFPRLLRDSAGTWKRGEGLAYQRRLRGEWGRE